ncbi:hypothetical protein PHMEG_00030446, partial [Phytophthora megakarya]
KWGDLLRSFQIQYCGHGVSVASQYYHARRRSDESPLDYLYRLNVAGLRARLKIKDGSAKDRREHVDHQEHRSKIQGDGFNRNRCSHCGSKKHSNLGCWRRVTCTKCGKRGHPADHCLFVCRGCGELHDMGKCPMEEFYNQIRQSFNPTKHMGRSSGWNPIRAERSRYCIYAFVHKTSVDQVSKQRHLPDNTRDLYGNHTFAISSLRQADEYARSDVTMTVDLHPGESRGYWKQKDPDLWFKPADQETTTEITKPSRIAEYRRSGSPPTLDLLPGESRGYWGCYIDSSQIQDCVGIGDNVYRTEGRTRIKVTLAGLVYFFDIWVGDLSGQEAILGMDFMVPAGIRLDLAHGSISLPDEVRIQLSGRRQLYSDKAGIVNLGQYLRIQPGGSAGLPLRLRTSDHEIFWVNRGDHWVPTTVHGPGKIRYMRITNVGD